MNVIIFKGNISRDIDLKFAQGSGMAVAKFGLAVARMKKDDPADFFNCIAFGKTAELIANSLRKGSPILINGHLQSGKYDKDGHTVFTTDVIVDRFEFISKKEDDNSNNSNQSRSNSSSNTGTNNFGSASDITPIDDGDIPF